MNSITELISTLDIVIFALVIAITLFAVVYGQVRRRKEPETFVDFLLMGRRLTLPLFVATLVATWYGGIFGVTSIAFEHGVYNFVTQGVFWYITYIIFAIFLVQKVRISNVATLPELVGKLYGPRSRKLSAVFSFFNVVPIAYSISIGLLIQALLGIDLTLAILLGTLFVVVYSTLGGFRAVVLSDVVQFGVMCLAVVLVLLLSMRFYGGFDYLRSHLPNAHFELTGGMGWLATFSWGLIALSTLVDPNFYHRCFAAESSATARKGIFLSTLIWIGFDVCTTAGALYARAAMPEADPSNAYLIYSIGLLPDGLKGFFLAGIAATILSTLDSYLFIAGTSLSHDLLPKTLPKWLNRLSNRRSLHHLSVLLVGLLSAGLAVVFSGNIKLVWKTLGSYSAACLLIPVMWGFLFRSRLNDLGFLLTCTFSVVATTAWRLSERTSPWDSVDEIYVGSIISILAILTLLRFDQFRQKLN